MMDGEKCCTSSSGVKKIMVPLAGLVLIILGIYLIGLARNAWKNYDYIGKPLDNKNIVAFEGTGKVTAKPDVAQINIGIVTEKTTVAQAQKENTDKMNAIVAALKGQFKIEDKDIKTSQYTINPKYDWSTNVQKLTGYTVTQAVQVKARDFDKIGDILAKAGELGANNVAGPNFIIDDPETFREQARKEAIDQAKAKAKTLANQLGIKLGSIVYFSEGGAQPYMQQYDTAQSAMGGAGLEKAVAPVIESGSQDVSVTVTISYEIR